MPKKHETIISDMMKERVQEQAIDYGSLEFLAAGRSGVIYIINEERILKEFHRESINVKR
jgi:hypothetical protein